MNTVRFMAERVGLGGVAGLAPERDLWGREVKLESNFGRFYDLVSPLYAMKESNDPVEQAMVKNDFTWVRTGTDDSTQELFRHLATMKALAFFKGSSYACKIPHVVLRAKGFWCVLRAHDPSVIRQSSVWVRTIIRVNELSR